MDKQSTTDNKFYIVLAMATLALIIGTAGLIVGLQRPSEQDSLGGGMNTTRRLPTTSDMQTTEIDPSTGHGVAESPKKN